jgi:hypothetical protein
VSPYRLIGDESVLQWLRRGAPHLQGYDESVLEDFVDLTDEAVFHEVLLRFRRDLERFTKPLRPPAA